MPVPRRRVCLKWMYARRSVIAGALRMEPPAAGREGTATAYCPTRNSMRRLRARPSSVLFDAIG